MDTLVQVFYSKFCEYPKEAFKTNEVKTLVKKAYDLILEKEGIEQANYFKNLMSICEVFD